MSERTNGKGRSRSAESLLAEAQNVIARGDSAEGAVECVLGALRVMNLPSELPQAFAACVDTVAALSRVGAAGASTPLSVFAIEHGHAFGAPNGFFSGLTGLLESVEQTQEPASFELLAAYLPVVCSRFIEHELSPQIADRLLQSAWLPSALARLKHAEQRREAAEQGDLERVRALSLSRGSGVDARAPESGLPTALIAAAFSGHTAVVAYLLEQGASVEPINLQGRNALMLAADQGYDDVVARLIGAGAALNCADIFHQTALHIAGWQNHVEVVRQLVKAGAALDAVEKQGMTPLALSSTEDVPGVVRVLLDAGAQVDCHSIDGHTPLMLAAMEGHASVVELLLEAGAERSLKDRHGLSAADWAQREKKDEVSRLLASR